MCRSPVRPTTLFTERSPSWGEGGCFVRSRSPRWDRVIYGPHLIAHRVDVLFNREVVYTGLPITAGEVIFNRNDATLAQCTVQVSCTADDDPRLLPTASAGGVLSPYGYELQVWRGITYHADRRPEQTIVVVGDSVPRFTESGTTRLTESGTIRVTEGSTTSSMTIPAAEVDDELMPLGVFPIQRASFDGVTLLATVSGADRSQLVIDARLEADYVIAAGTNTATAIQALITAGVGGIEFAFQSTTNLTPAIVLPAGADRWEEAQKMARDIGCELSFDGLGRCVLRSEPGAQTDPVVTLSTGEGRELTAVSLVLDREPAYNRVIATGENSTNAAVYRGVATEDDPVSPSFYSATGFGRKPRFYFSPFIASDEQAASAAAAILRSTSGVERGLSFEALPNPALEPGDVVRVICPSLDIDELHIIDAFSIGLTADALMGIG